MIVPELWLWCHGDCHFCDRLGGFLREPNKVSGFWSLTMVLLLYKKIQWLHKCQLPTINSVLVTRGRTSQIPRCWGLLGVRGWGVSVWDSPSSHGAHTHSFPAYMLYLDISLMCAIWGGRGTNPPPHSACPCRVDRVCPPSPPLPRSWRCLFHRPL